MNACPWSGERSSNIQSQGVQETSISSSVFLCWGWTSVKSLKFAGPSISTFFKRGVQVAVFTHCRLPSHAHRFWFCIGIFSQSPALSQPLVIFFSQSPFLFAFHSVLYFSPPTTFFHNMALSLLSSTGFVSQSFSLLLSPAFSAPPLYLREIFLGFLFERISLCIQTSPQLKRRGSVTLMRMVL